LATWIKKEDPTICCLQETHLINRKKHWLRVKGWKIYQAIGPKTRQSRLQTYIDQMRKGDKEGLSILIKGEIHQK
jgi:exonuclease III